MRLATLVRLLIRLTIRRGWQVSILCVVVAPLIWLNYSTSLHNNDAMVFDALHSSDNLNMDEVILGSIKGKYLQRQFGGKTKKDEDDSDPNWWKKNSSEERRGEVYYHREQIIASELNQAYQEYERACSERLSRGSNITPKTIPGAPAWQNKLTGCQERLPDRYYLSAVLQIRIYNKDRARWTIKELKQWIHYILWTGVEHIYLCDHYRLLSEMLYSRLKTYIDLGLITYLPWHHIRMPMKAQVDCYQYMIDKYGYDSTWHIAIDMDEYPHVLNDTQEGCLVRYLNQLSYSVSELSLHNYLMLGQGDRRRTMAIERITRMTPQPANELDKPIYRPSRVVASIHHNMIRHGRRLESNDEEIRLLHYWGARLQNWGPDTPETRLKTIEFPVLRDTVAPLIRQSLLVFGELNAFSNSTGP